MNREKCPLLHYKVPLTFHQVIHVKRCKLCCCSGLNQKIMLIFLESVCLFAVNLNRDYRFKDLAGLFSYCIVAKQSQYIYINCSMIY